MGMYYNILDGPDGPTRQKEDEVEELQNGAIRFQLTAFNRRLNNFFDEVEEAVEELEEAIPELPEEEEAALKQITLHIDSLVRILTTTRNDINEIRTIRGW